MTRRVKLTVAYLGTAFSGWQRQSRDPSVQAELERALSDFCGGREAPVVGAGRTDAGVHARGQVMHADLAAAIPLDALCEGLNARLPHTIRIRRARWVTGDFHARFDARAKLYTYRARWTRSTLPWRDQRVAVLRPISCEKAFFSCLRRLPGRRDMASFTTPECAARVETLRTLHAARAQPRRNGLDLEFLGGGFLRYQVRRMVGALFQVGWNQLSEQSFTRLLDEARAGACSLTAPASGLTLERVYYSRPKGFEALDPRPGNPDSSMVDSDLYADDPQG